MHINLNGEAHELPRPCTVRQLLAQRDLTDRPAAVEVNGAVVPKSRHAEHTLTDGDRVEIVTLVGGG